MTKPTKTIVEKKLKRSLTKLTLYTKTCKKLKMRLRQLLLRNAPFMD